MNKEAQVSNDSTAALTDGTRSELLTVDGLVKDFPLSRGLLGRRKDTVRAVDGVSFSVDAGHTLGIVGESGSGKSTLGRCVLRLVEPTAGRIRFHGEDVSLYRGAKLRQYHRRAGMVFQDPFGTLNPRMTVEEALAEPLRVHAVVEGRQAVRLRVGELLEVVGLDGIIARRYPRELSGGQRQRVAIARAIGLGPELLILDEPVASLDVSIGAQILNLLADLQRDLGVAYVLITHDLSVVRHLARRVGVMYLGAMMEVGTPDDLFERPQHPYTQALLSAVPVPDPDRERQRVRIRLAGEVPTSIDLPTGCRFHPRCPRARAECTEQVPALDPVGPRGQRAACLFAAPLEVL